MIKKVVRNDARIARHDRIRNKISGTKDVPRLNVFRSNSNIFAQIIDDEAFFPSLRRICSSAYLIPFPL